MEKVTVELDDNDIDKLTKIVNFTANSWQENRKFEEKFNDSLCGKMAEKCLKIFIEKEFGDFVLSSINITSSEIKEKDFENKTIAFYDDFRMDEFKQHNDVDLIIAPNNSLLLLSIDRIIEESQKCKNNYFSLSKDLVQSFRQNNILVGEIKSTRISQRHLNNDETINFEKILNDDFLEYPTFLRKTEKDSFNQQDYYQHVKENCFHNNPDFKMENLIQIEKDNLKDFYIRIYVDKIYKNENNKFCADCYIVSVMTNKNFIQNDKIEIKKMPLKNKSEKALYLFSPLKNGMNIKSFLKYKMPNNKNIINNFIQKHLVRNEEQNLISKTLQRKI